jgi:hypothetical protein
MPAGRKLSMLAQVEMAQMVLGAYLAHPPSPVQVPVCPQVSGASWRQALWGSAAPAGTEAHSPIVSGWLQLTHAPVQGTLQQTPSAQFPESHCSALEHTVPTGRLRLQAAPVQHRPFGQAPIAQSPSQAHS